MLMAARLAWSHYFVLTLLPTLIVFRPRPADTAADSPSVLEYMVGGLALVLIARTPLRMIVELPMFVVAILSAVGTVCLFVLSLREMFRPEGSTSVSTV